MSDLMPCPFCGGAAVPNDGASDYKHWVSCSDCACNFGLWGDDQGTFNTPELAAAAWNSRTVQAQIDATREAALEDAANEVLKLITGYKKATLADAHARLLALLWMADQT
jgi:hypothetical protein